MKAGSWFCGFWLLSVLGCGADPAKVAPASTGSVENVAVPVEAPLGEGGPRRGRRGEGRPKVEPTAMILNPVTQKRVASYFVEPTVGQAPFPTLVVLPAALNESGSAVISPKLSPFRESGIALWYFDQEGRGASEGTDNTGGPDAQASLIAVLEYIAADPRVNKDAIGVLSLSAGLITAAGALASNSAGAKFLIDWEGPANREHHAQCSSDPVRASSPAALAMPWGPCDDDVYWSSREPDKQIGKLKIPYQRVQYEENHNGDTHDHAIDMVKAALKGDVPWVRINDEPVNKAVATESDVAYLPNVVNVNVDLARYARELFQSELKISLPEPSADTTHRAGRRP
jgi:hypothetical protein